MAHQENKTQRTPQARIAPLLIGFALLGLCGASSGAVAQTFVYTPRDLLLGFRQVGATSELLVNLGPVSSFAKAKPGELIPVTQVTPEQIKNAFSTLDNLQWSALASVRVADGGDPAIPESTIWTTRPRINFDTRTDALKRKSEFSQALAANKIDSIARGGVTLGSQSPADPLSNTKTLVLEPAGNKLGYAAYATTKGNLGGTVQASVEANTKTFTSAIRSDLYELLPSDDNELATYLGYFELSPEGVIFFKAAGGTVLPVERPIIQGIARDVTTSKVTFGTMNDSTIVYRLCITNSLGLNTPIEMWPVCVGEVKGDGKPHTLEDQSVEDNRFYAIKAGR